MTQERMLELREALEVMSSILGREARAYELYNAVGSQRIRREPLSAASRRYRFNESDVRAEAEAIRARAALTGSETTVARPNIPLLNSRQALERMNASSLNITRPRFFKLGVPVAWKTKHSGNDAYYYSAAEVDRKIDELLAQRDGLMSSRQAVVWLNERFERVLESPVTPDRFYHWLHRGQLTNTTKRQHGTWFEYRFSEADLLASPAVQTLQRRLDNLTGREVPNITTSEQLRALEAVYGPLVTDRGAADLASRDGAPISLAAIKARRQRGTLPPVARMGSALLFPQRAVKPGREIQRPAGSRSFA